MNVLAWFSPDVVQALGWTLIHFLWQGLALALIFQFLQLFCRSARGRYNLAFLTLLAMAAAPILTYSVVRSLGETASIGEWPLHLGSRDVWGTFPDSATFSVTPANAPWLSHLVMVWFAGVALLSLRVSGGWYVANSLRRRDTAPLPAALAARCERLCAALAITRPVRFLQSTFVKAPAVVGWLRPVVLIPVSVVLGLTSAQLEAVIMHELAHIRRLDAAANLLQMAVETVLFYHPAVWWISRRIRIEREHCCDDVAVAMSGDALGYAKALASLEEWRGVEPVLAATGGVLKQRIARLLGANVPTNAASAVCASGIGLFGLVACLVAHGTDVKAAAPVGISPITAAIIEHRPIVETASALMLTAPLVTPNIPAREDHPKTAPEKRKVIRRVRPAPPRDANAVALEAAGLQKLDAVDVMALNVARVTPEYVRALQTAGLNLNSISGHELAALKTVGVTPDLVSALQAMNIKDLTTRDYFTAHARGLTPEFLETVRRHNFTNLGMPQLIAFKNIGAF